MKADDIDTALSVLIDMQHYDSLMDKHAPIILTGLAYCLVFKHKDYERASKMLELV